MYDESGILLSQIASIHTYTGSDDLACRYYQMAMDVFENQQDTNAILGALRNLGYAYLELGDTLSGIKCFRRWVALARLKEKFWHENWAYEALCYAFAGKNLDSARYYFAKADTAHWWNYGWMCQALAEAYRFAGPEYYAQAIPLIRQAVARTGLKQPLAMFRAAELLFLVGNYPGAMERLDAVTRRVRNYLERIDHNRFSELNEKMEFERVMQKTLEQCYFLYYRLDTALGNNDRALQHLVLATQWRDSIHNDQFRKQTAMMQGTFETESSQMRLGMLQKDNEVKDLRIRQSRILLFGMGGFLLVIILMAVLLIRQNKIRAEHRSVLLEQKLLRLQMNPHFIFNALSNIMNFVEKKQADNAIRYLSNFSSLLRSTLETTRKDHILLEDEVKGLTHYLELQKLRYGEKFDFMVSVDDKLDPEDVVIPPMLIQPFIENAIEHGIQHKESKGNIDVRFTLQGKQIICEVEDDGVGREKAYEFEYQQKTHKSLATDIIRDRIAALNRKLKQKISFDITDLRTEDNLARGTLVRLELPFMSEF
jgi:tetratricopeptide (TPR) repeat protein